jgi:hypothetical protein
VLKPDTAALALEALARYFNVTHKKNWILCVLLRSYAHYYRPRWENRDRVAFGKEAVLEAYARYLQDAELPNWLLRVYALEVKRDEPDAGRSIEPLDRWMKFFW